MSALGYTLKNHEWCLEELMKRCADVYAPYEDLIFPYNLMDLINVLVTEFFKLGFTCMIEEGQNLDEYIFTIASKFAARQAFGTAFAGTVLGFLKCYNPKIDWMATIEWRKKVEEDLEKYNDEMQVFEPLFKKLLKMDDLTKPIFHYLELLHDTKCYVYYGAKGQIEEAADYRFHCLRKRFELNFMPNGLTHYLFRILENCLWYLNAGRFKQVRHLLAVVSELMKSVNQDTEVFMKLKEFFFMVKTMHWATILCRSELKEAVIKIQNTTENYNVIPKERVIPFGIPLPDGEDLDLPTELIETEVERGPIYKKLWTYKHVLKRSTLAHIASMYDNVLACDINYQVAALRPTQNN